ncbi:DUF4835 family protein [Hyphobacterium sp. CCMP332]|nr:DUF4835 family protein [Hyphobacterium sp. CCMP332]
MRIIQIILILFFISLGINLKAQELNCRVIVDANRIQLSDKTIFDDMQQAIWEFMNNNVWTNDIYTTEERIKCNLFITITEMPVLNRFKATVQITSSRPIYGTSYESLLFNFVDKDWDFEYAQSQPLQFAEQTFNSNLTSLLGFYAYCIIGLDYDSYSRLGGTAFYQKAQTVMQNAQQASNAPGWQPFEGNLTRYWLIENLMNQAFQKFREGVYVYHRQGFDKLAKEPEDARKQIVESLKLYVETRKRAPISVLYNNYFNGKTPEIVNVFQEGAPLQKQEVHKIMTEIDPTQVEEYDKILKG